MVFHQCFQFTHKTSNILEFPIYRSKTDIGHLIQIFNSFITRLPISTEETSCFNSLRIFFSTLLQFPQSGLKKCFSFRRHESGRCEVYCGQKAHGCRFLNDANRDLLHRFIGSKAPSAGKALAPPADRSPVIGIPGISDLRIRTAAIWAFHNSSPWKDGNGKRKKSPALNNSSPSQIGRKSHTATAVWLSVYRLSLRRTFPVPCTCINPARDCGSKNSDENFYFLRNSGTAMPGVGRTALLKRLPPAEMETSSCRRNR